MIQVVGLIWVVFTLVTTVAVYWVPTVMRNAGGNAMMVVQLERSQDERLLIPVVAHVPVPDSFIHYITKYKSPT